MAFNDNLMIDYLMHANRLIGRYCQDNLHISVWLDKLSNFMACYEIPDDKKITLLMLMLDCKIFLRLVKQLAPLSLNIFNLTYKSIANELLSMRDLNDENEFRVKFRDIVQQEHEHTRDYANKLLEIYRTYNTILEVSDVHEQFLKGLRNTMLAIHLGKKRIISFQNLVDAAINLEYAFVLTNNPPFQ